MNKYAIVLAQGIARFDFLREHFVLRFGLESLLGDRFHYFRKIASHLRANGFDVYHTKVSFAAGVGQRAQELQQEVYRVLAEDAKKKGREAERVHVIGHSMGGLDARHMIVDLGMQARVASVTTVGTPHAGTSFADWGFENRGDQIIRALERVIDLSGFLDLTTASCREFNARAREAEAASGVFYQAYGSFQEFDEVLLPLRPSWNIINRSEIGNGRDGRNDGLVPLASQLWPAAESEGVDVRREEFPTQADHFNQAGWWDISEREGREEYEAQIRSVYLDIARHLPHGDE